MRRRELLKAILSIPALIFTGCAAVKVNSETKPAAFGDEDYAAMALARSLPPGTSVMIVTDSYPDAIRP